MAHPLIELRRLMTPASAVVTGAVIRIENDQITVATAKGTIMARRTPGDASVYPIGASVKIEPDGTLRGRTETGSIYVV